MIIKIRIHSKSGRKEVVEKSESEYEVFVKAEAENNKANIEMISLLEKYFGKKVKIKRGFKSREKVVEVINGNKI